MKELEIHFLEIDVEKFQKTLNDVRAVKIIDTMIKDVIYEYPLDPEWQKKHKRVRVRDDGQQIELCYKERDESNVFGANEEIETIVSNKKEISDILLALGLRVKRVAEKRRIRYLLDSNIKVDIEYWPKIPPYIEIEGENEEAVKSAVARLGLRWEDGNFLDAKEIYEKIYDIPIENIKILTFEKFE